MKLKDKQLLQAKTVAQLNTDLIKEANHLTKLKLDLKTNQLKDTSQIKKTKTTIAVLKTIIHQKQLQDLKKPKVENIKTKKDK